MNNPKQLNLNVKLDEAIKLENFIICPSTEVILKACREFISRSNNSNTFLLWGNEGTGKNYLLHSINREFINKNLHSTFISFDNSLLDNPSVLEGLEELDVIFIESMEQFPNSKEWEIALFNLINACLLKDCKIFISSKVTAKHLEINLVDLKSRLLSFPAFELPEINEDEKLKAMEEAASRKGLKLEDNVLSYILTHTSRNLSDLMSLMNELDTFSLEKKRKVSIALVREMISNK
tara:strand:- start:397 stop:1104 length:708 start_codon:yes stop_codon:yes gene_type:complete